MQASRRACHRQGVKTALMDKEVLNKIHYDFGILIYVQVLTITRIGLK